MNGSIYAVIPGRVVPNEIDGFVNFGGTCEPGIHTPCGGYGFRAFNIRWLRQRVLNPGMTNREVAR